MKLFRVLWDTESKRHNERKGLPDFSEKKTLFNKMAVYKTLQSIGIQRMIYLNSVRCLGSRRNELYVLSVEDFEFQQKMPNHI